MKNYNILLCCGAGMSSGFLAQKMRQEAKKQKVEVTISAKSTSEVGVYASEIDILFMGPHYERELPNMKKLCDPYNVPVMLIPQAIYGSLDGAAMLKLALDTLEDKKGDKN